MVRSMQLPDKLFFKIGEVADIVGVKPHVLRYWESEFNILRPMKTRGAHRVYKRRDVELAAIIRRLLHDEGYTIPGAKKKLREIRQREAKDGGEEGRPAPVRKDAAREVALRAELVYLRDRLSLMLSALQDADDKVPDRPVTSATVTAVVPSPVPATRRAR